MADSTNSSKLSSDLHMHAKACVLTLHAQYQCKKSNVKCKISDLLKSHSFLPLLSLKEKPNTTGTFWVPTYFFSFPIFILTVSQNQSHFCFQGFLFWKQGLSVQLWPSWNLLCRPGQPHSEILLPLPRPPQQAANHIFKSWITFHCTYMKSIRIP